MESFNVFNSQLHFRPWECGFSFHYSSKTVLSSIINDLDDSKSSTKFKILIVFVVQIAFDADVHCILLEIFTSSNAHDIHILSFSSASLKFLSVSLVDSLICMHLLNVDVS